MHPGRLPSDLSVLRDAQGLRDVRLVPVEPLLQDVSLGGPVAWLPGPGAVDGADSHWRRERVPRPRGEGGLQHHRRPPTKLPQVWWANIKQGNPVAPHVDSELSLCVQTRRPRPLMQM